MRIQILLDTNFLFIPIRFGVDIFDEFERILGSYEPIVTSVILEELKGLDKNANPLLMREINFTSRIVKRCKLFSVKLEEGESVDEHLIRVAKELDAIVATTDTLLKKKLRSEGIPVTYLRQKSYLELEGIGVN